MYSLMWSTCCWRLWIEIYEISLVLLNDISQHMTYTNITILPPTQPSHFSMWQLRPASQRIHFNLTHNTQFQTRLWALGINSRFRVYLTFEIKWATKPNVLLFCSMGNILPCFFISFYRLPFKVLMIMSRDCCNYTKLNQVRLIRTPWFWKVASILQRSYRKWKY